MKKKKGPRVNRRKKKIKEMGLLDEEVVATTPEVPIFVDLANEAVVMIKDVGLAINKIVRPPLFAFVFFRQRKDEREHGWIK